MKRSNRLVLLIGIFLAIVAFVLIVLMLGNGDGGGGEGDEDGSGTAAVRRSPTASHTTSDTNTPTIGPR